MSTLQSGKGTWALASPVASVGFLQQLFLCEILSLSPLSVSSLIFLLGLYSKPLHLPVASRGGASAWNTADLSIQQEWALRSPCSAQVQRQIGGGLAGVVTENPHFINAKALCNPEACKEVTTVTDKNPPPLRQKERYRMGGVCVWEAAGHIRHVHGGVQPTLFNLLLQAPTV